MDCITQAVRGSGGTGSPGAGGGAQQLLGRRQLVLRCGRPSGSLSQGRRLDQRCQLISAGPSPTLIFGGSSLSHTTLPAVRGLQVASFPPPTSTPLYVTPSSARAALPALLAVRDADARPEHEAHDRVDEERAPVVVAALDVRADAALEEARLEDRARQRAWRDKDEVTSSVNAQERPTRGGGGLTAADVPDAAREVEEREDRSRQGGVAAAASARW